MRAHARGAVSERISHPIGVHGVRRAVRRLDTQHINTAAETEESAEGGTDRSPLAALPERPRFFTPRECARLQGFPDSFLIDGPNENRWYHQCGNAVCPGVVAKIAQKVVAALQPVS